MSHDREGWQSDCTLEYASSKNPQLLGKPVSPSCWLVGTKLLFFWPHPLESDILERISFPHTWHILEKENKNSQSSSDIYSVRSHLYSTVWDRKLKEQGNKWGLDEDPIDSPLSMTERHFIAPHFPAVCGICWRKNPVIILLCVILDLSHRFLQLLVGKPRKASEITLSSTSRVEQFLALLMLKAVSPMRLEPKLE